MKIHVHGLLHLAEGEKSAVNTFVRSFRDQVRTYFQCALLLSRSLEKVGVSFVLLTNDREALRSLVGPCIDDVRVEEIRCESAIPSGTRFYSSHFKLDAFKYLAGSTLDYLVLCDLDVVCLNPLPQEMIDAADAGVPMAYDITIEASCPDGSSRLVKDLELLTLQQSEGRWKGGEFLAGPPSFFEALCGEIDVIMPRYLEHLTDILHVSDEAPTSAAIECMKRKGYKFLDAGEANVIYRYWSAYALHPQEPLRNMANYSLVHFPADKKFLAKLGAHSKWQPETFLPRYRRYLFRRQPRNFVLGRVMQVKLVRRLRKKLFPH